MRNMACVELTEEFSFPERVTRHVSVQGMSLPASSCWPRKTFSLWFADLHIRAQPSSKHTTTGSARHTHSPGLLNLERSKGARELESAIQVGDGSSLAEQHIG